VGRLWNELAVSYFKVKFCHLLGGAEETMTPCRIAGLNVRFEPGISKYKAGMLTM